jgi:hypothetical protein
LRQDLRIHPIAVTPLTRSVDKAELWGSKNVARPAYYWQRITALRRMSTLHASRSHVRLLVPRCGYLSLITPLVPTYTRRHPPSFLDQARPLLLPLLAVHTRLRAIYTGRHRHVERVEQRPLALPSLLEARPVRSQVNGPRPSHSTYHRRAALPIQHFRCAQPFTPGHWKVEHLARACSLSRPRGGYTVFLQRFSSWEGVSSSSTMTSRGRSAGSAF